MNIDFELIARSMPFLLGGAVMTVGFTTAAVGLGTVVGLLTALGRLSKVAPLRWVAGAYIDFIRGTPLLVQIYIIYFGLPSLGLRLPATTAGVMALTINSGAYVAEIFRAGILSIERGQREAALSLGMTPLQVMRYVILPQAFRNILPPMGNEYVILTKDSSLVSIIGMRELLYRTNLVAARTYDYFSLYVGCALVYFALTFVIARSMGRVERRLRIPD